MALGPRPRKRTRWSASCPTLGIKDRGRLPKEGTGALDMSALAGRLGGGSYPMGDYQMLVRGEVMRGRFRNSFEKPQAFTPNKVEKVKFELPDVAHTFQKGHRIMIQIQSSWFPLVDRNPQQFVNIYEADAKDYIKSKISIWHDAKNSSSIVLPVLK